MKKRLTEGQIIGFLRKVKELCRKRGSVGRATTFRSPLRHERVGCTAYECAGGGEHQAQEAAGQLDAMREELKG